MGRGESTIDFIIGGSLGLSPEVMRRADEAVSFSKLTFPHQLMRVILLEQIYRSFRILNHEPYHK
jgi:23S rRNA (pseudouridine1915-N3)-methyltransferase